MILLQNSWEDGSHRRLCSNKKKSVLENLPRPLEVNCPKCLAVSLLLIISDVIMILRNSIIEYKIVMPWFDTCISSVDMKTFLRNGIA